MFVLAPFFLYSTFFIAFLNNDKAPRLSTIANITGTLLNVVLDVVLITLLGWGLPGIWVASILDEAFKATVYLLRWKSGKWQSARV